MDRAFGYESKKHEFDSRSGGQRILINLRQLFVFISFKVRDKDLSEEKQRNFFQMILFLIPMLSGNLLKIQYLQEFFM